MSKVCQISKKKGQYGNSVSHANNKHRKKWLVNLQTKRLFDSESKKWVRLRVSTRMLRTIDRKGLSRALRDEGMSLQELVSN